MADAEGGRARRTLVHDSSLRKRRVLLPDGAKAHLWPLLKQQPVKTKYSLEVRAAWRRKARSANMVVRACKVTIDVRDKRTSERSRFDVNVVQAIEHGTTPVGEKPIQWTLLTNRPIEVIKDMTDVIAGYSMRWRIEDLHRTWKSGTCSVEDTQLRSAGAATKWATILMGVAVRIERIKQLSREQPDLPAKDEFSPAEIKAAALLYFGKSAKTKLKADDGTHHRGRDAVDRAPRRIHRQDLQRRSPRQHHPLSRLRTSPSRRPSHRGPRQ